jgi:cytochrome c-type biogenesis protein CcmF
MNIDPGQFALIIALGIAVVQVLIPLWGAHQQHQPMMAVAWPAAMAQCLMLALALFFLGDAFVRSDFSVSYVAQHSNTMLPTMYKVAAIWGGHEGSILLWVFLLSAWSLAYSLSTRNDQSVFNTRILAINGISSVGFLLFILLTSNPFAPLSPVPLQGSDLNPLLQDPAFIIHPPMLYMGYVGFSIAFSAAIAILIEGNPSPTWAKQIRGWTLAAWSFLTLGIGLGSWWAYYELGWGGWWFWDPVENASLMPWIAGTALVHSIFSLQRKQLFHRSVILLSITSFTLSLLGTFLVRSGVLTSVHAFASDPERGLFILLFLAAMAGGSFFLYGLRAQHFPRASLKSIWARETLVAAGNLFLLVALATVMLGTLYPLILSALDLGKLSVGPPYFNAVMVPIMSLAALLMAIAPSIRWNNTDASLLSHRITYPLLCGSALALGFALFRGPLPLYSAVGLFISGFLLGAMIIAGLKRLSNSRVKPGSGWYAMFCAHTGAAIFAAGVALSSAYSIETEQILSPGESAEIGAYTFQFNGVTRQSGPNYTAFRGDFNVLKDGAIVAHLFPEKRRYPSTRNAMTEAAIDSRITRDFYVALGNRGTDDAWSVRLYVKPFLSLIWIGIVMIATGGLIGVSGVVKSARAATTNTMRGDRHALSTEVTSS